MPIWPKILWKSLADYCGGRFGPIRRPIRWIRNSHNIQNCLYVVNRIRCLSGRKKHNKDVTDIAEIFTEASTYALTPSKLGGTWSDSDSSRVGVRRFGPITCQFSKFFRPDRHRMRCWQRTTVSNTVQFPNRLIRPSNRYQMIRWRWSVGEMIKIRAYRERESFKSKIS